MSPDKRLEPTGANQLVRNQQRETGKDKNKLVGGMECLPTKGYKKWRR